MSIDSLRALQLELWSPASEGTYVPPGLGARTRSAARCSEGLERIQAFRDGIFLRDHGFRWPQDYLDYDRRCWHLTFCDGAGALVATMRTAVYPLAGFCNIGDLQICRYIRALSRLEADPYLAAINGHLGDAAQADTAWLFEPGGWAIDPPYRKSRVSALLPLAIWALGRLLGSGIGFAAATVPNGSSSVLRRLGALPLRSDTGALAPIHSDFHGCEMEILAFSTERLAPEFERIVDRLTATIAASAILTPSGGSRLCEAGDAVVAG